MKSTVILSTAMLVALAQFGCGTSCGKKREPLLWADGITRESNGTRLYETTPMDGTWLHFPSYRRFRLVHGFGTKDVSVEAYVSLVEDEPAKQNDATKFTRAGSGDVLWTIEDQNTVIVENTTCENDYFVFVRIAEKSEMADGGTAGGGAI